MPVREVLFYEFDDFRLDLSRHELLKDGVPVSLTHKAFQILLILVQNFGQTVEKENIYQHLWADSFVEDSNLTQHIYILRKTLGPDPLGESYIETVARSGYRFTAEVRCVNSPPIAAMSELAPDIEDETDAPIPPAKPYLTLLRNGDARLPERDEHPHMERSVPPDEQINRSSNFKRSITAVALGGLVIVALIGIFYFVSRRPAAPFGSSRNRSIAVLPFKPIGDETNNQKLGLGMADAVITRLGKLRDIPVRPTSAVFHYTDQPPENSAVAGREMAVDTVLEGTVQRENDRVRVSVRLMSVADGKTIWAEYFDENSTDIFAVQDSISAKVVQALQITLTPQQETALAEHSTVSTEANQAYQLGVYFAGSRTKDGLLKGVEYFQKAIDTDPNYARSYALLADTYNMLSYYRFKSRMEMKQKAEAAALKALQLDDKVPEAYIALAFLRLNDQARRSEAKPLIERAIELAPFNSTARVRYGWILLSEQNLEATVQQMRLSQEYDPLSPISNGALCQALEYQGKFDEAIKYCEKSVELSPDLYNSQMALAEVYFVAGRHSEAVELGEKVLVKNKGEDRLIALTSLGYFHAKLGNTTKAKQIGAEIRTYAVRRPGLLNDLAVISYAMGDREEGFAYFEQSYNSRVLAILHLYNDPIWADVRSDTRVMETMQQ